MEVCITLRQTRYKSCNGGNRTVSGDGAILTLLTFKISFLIGGLLRMKHTLMSSLHFLNCTGPQ
jgi:hypothetical protein